MLRAKGKIRAISLLLVLVCMFTVTNVYAQSFKDVPSTHWAYNYIEEMSRENIIAGDAGKFSPGNNVTKPQAVAMLVRAMKIDATKTKQARQQHETLLTQAGVQEWFKNNIAVALTAGIVTETELKDFYLKGREVDAQRLDVVRYMTRAMGLADEAKKSTIIALSFIDIESVSIEDRQFIKMLVDKGVLNPKGDGQYRFNPNKPITRAEMATMTSKCYDYLKQNLLFNILPNTEPEKPKQNTMDVTGKITSVTQIGTEFYITVKNKLGATTTFRVNSKSEVRLDGTKIAYNDLAVGQEIEAVVEENSLFVLALKAESLVEEIEGIVKSVETTRPYSITVDYKLNSKSSSTERRTFSVDSDTDITLNGKTAYLKNIKEGDTAIIYARNGKVLELDAESKHREVEGVIKEVKIASDSEITIVDENDKEHKFSIDSKATIYRNDRKAKLEELKKGDEVVLELEYDAVIDIDASVVESTDKGIIETLLLSRTNSRITIRRSDDTLVTYDVASNADIKLSRNTASISDLKVGYYVEVDIEGEEIVSIAAIARESSNTKRGIVEYISYRSGLIEITELDFTTGEKRSISIYVTDKTTYIDIDGDIASFNAIDEDDEIIVSGEFIGRDFTAKSIMIVGTSN